jgi:hypothetical protein
MGRQNFAAHRWMNSDNFSTGRIETVISYLRQVAICESVREAIKRALARNDDVSVRLAANNIDTTETVLRAVSLLPSLDTEEKLKDFIVEQMLSSLRLTADQKERLDLNS